MKRLILLALCAISTSASADFVCYDTAIGTSTHWTVGNKFYGAWSNPDYCYATGAELLYIQQHFVGLRGRVGPRVSDGYAVTTWGADDSAFIVDNL